MNNFYSYFLFADLLKRGSDPKIVFMSSGLAPAHQMSVENLYDSAPKFETYFMGYANSKAYNILVAQELSKKVAKYGIKVNAADPGVVRTPIFDGLQGPGFRKFILRMITNCTNFLFATVRCQSVSKILRFQFIPQVCQTFDKYTIFLLGLTDCCPNTFSCCYK